MGWIMERPVVGGVEAIRFRLIHTYTEIVRPTVVEQKGKETILRAIVKTGAARDYLILRYGFVCKRMEPIECVVPHHPGFKMNRYVGTLSPPNRRITRESDPVAVDAWNAWKFTRQTIPGGTKKKRIPISVTRKALPVIPEYLITPEGNVGVVMVVTGWGKDESDAVRALVHVMDELDRIGRTGSVAVVVQNYPPAHEDMRAEMAAMTDPRIDVVYSDNRGFSAANNAGFESLPSDIGWVVFTQADVKWDGRQIEKAIRTAYGCRNGGPPAHVGPSGGVLPPQNMTPIRELGENVGMEVEGVVPVDFVTGYWLLADVATVRKIGGWDANKYFLYWEDVDFSFRMAMAGSRPVMQFLDIPHLRSWTIKGKMFSLIHTEQIRDWSWQNFKSTWEPYR